MWSYKASLPAGRVIHYAYTNGGREGLFIHDAVRGAIGSTLAARDPDTHREYRRAAWTYLQERSRPTYPADMWHHTADLLFLLENAPLERWEGEILSARVARYQSSMLDQLCLTGEIAWGRLSCAPADASVRRASARITVG